MMEVIEKMTNKKKEKTFPMNEMTKGQVCFILKVGCYVLKVESISISKPIFLILGNHDKMDCYSPDCTLPVHNLYKGESVTIKFS